MNYKYSKLHAVNLLIRVVMWFAVYVGFRYTQILPTWLSTVLCVVCLVLEMVVHYGYVTRDQQNDRTLMEKIATMPLYDLAEAINKRDDIKKIVINEAEGDSKT